MLHRARLQGQVDCLQILLTVCTNHCKPELMNELVWNIGILLLKGGDEYCDYLRWMLQQKDTFDKDETSLLKDCYALAMTLLY